LFWLGTVCSMHDHVCSERTITEKHVKSTEPKNTSYGCCCSDNDLIFFLYFSFCILTNKFQMLGS
jgi:hypothetical protein